MYKYFYLLISLLVPVHFSHADEQVIMQIMQSVPYSVEDALKEYKSIQREYHDLRTRLNGQWIARRGIQAGSIAIMAMPFSEFKIESLRLSEKIFVSAASVLCLYAQWLLKVATYDKTKKNILNIRWDLRSLEKRSADLVYLEGGKELHANICKTISDCDKEINAIEAYEQRGSIAQCFLP
ncbi:hypothetical protein HYX58_05940 [Candidatus Dependentiae bacterium]|nr:hypothetical protein [Candidatus Dependentiae bacterium]